MRRRQNLYAGVGLCALFSGCALAQMVFENMATVQAARVEAPRFEVDPLWRQPVADVALFLRFRCNKEQQTAASAGTRRRSEIAGFYER